MSLSEKLDFIIDRIEEVDNNLKSIESQLEKIIITEEKLEKNIKENTEDCKKMSQHIDFIHKVYTTLRSPLNFLTSKFTTKKDDLPALEENTNSNL